MAVVIPSTEYHFKFTNEKGVVYSSKLFHGDRTTLIF